MRKSRCCGDSDLRAMIEAGTESVEWVRQEFARADLSQETLANMLIALPL